MTVHIAVAVRTTRANAIIAAIDAGGGPGVMKVYGDAQPANADTALGAQTHLLDLVFNDPCGTESGGVITFDITPAITDDAIATDTATWARLVDSTGATVVDLTAGTDFTLTDATLETGQTVTIASATWTEPA